MKIIVPVDITPDMLQHEAFEVMPNGEDLIVQVEQPFRVARLSTNVPESEYPAWTEDTYEQGDRVVLGHLVYEVLAESTDDSPVEGAGKSPPTWLSIGPTNRWAMFDDKIGTVTSNPDSIEINVQLGRGVDSIGFFGVDAGEVMIQVVDPHRGITYENINYPTARDAVEDWYGYFFDPIEIREDFVVSGIGATRSSAIKIRLLKPGGIAKVGAIVMGKEASLGATLHGTSVGIIDFSRKERDQFGNYIIVERGFSKRAEYDVSVDTDAVSRVQRTLAKYRAKPLIWIGHESAEATIVYGYYRSFDINISGPTKSDATITVEGLN